MSPNCIVMPDQQGADDKKSTKSVVNRKQKQMLNQEYIPEEEYDHYRDRIAMAGGDHRSKETRERSNTPTGKQPKGDTVYQAKLRKKHGGKIPSAYELVKADIEKKYGKGAIMDVKKKSKNKSKKKANVQDEFDLTKVAEAFGGYVIENIKDPKFSNPEAEKKFQDSPEGQRLKKTVRKTAKSLRSGFDTGELENPQDKKRQTRLDQEAKKRAQSGKNQSLKDFSNEPLDDVKTPDEVRDPKTGETLTKGGESQAEVEKRRAQVKRDAYSNPKTARKGERVVDQDQFSTRTGIIGRGGVEVTAGKGDGRKAGRTPEERKTGKVSYKDFAANQEVTKDKVTQSDREGDDFSASGEKDTTVRGKVSGNVDAKDSGETVTYTTPDKRKKRSDAGKPRVKKEPEVKKPDVTGDTEAKDSGEKVDYGKPDQETVTQSQTNKGGQTKFKDQRVTTGAGDGRKGQRTYKDFNKKVINVTQSKTDAGGQKDTVTYNTSPNVNINSPVETPPVETEKQGDFGDLYKNFRKSVDDAQKGSQTERERANRQLAGIQDPEVDAVRDKAEKDPKIKELDMTKRFSRAVDVVDPSKPRAKASLKTPEGRVSMLTALGSFAAKQAAPSLAGAEAGALLSRKDYRGAAAAAGQALGGPLGFVAGLYSMNRMLRGKGRVDTKNMQNAVRSAQQMQLGIPGMNMNQVLPQTQTQTQPAMGGGDRGEMELAALGAYTLPKAGEKLRNLKLPPVRGGRAGTASARGGGGL